MGQVDVGILAGQLAHLPQHPVGSLQVVVDPEDPAVEGGGHHLQVLLDPLRVLPHPVLRGVGIAVEGERDDSLALAASIIIYK